MPGDQLLKRWVYTHMEYDCVNNISLNPTTPLKAQCQDDAVREGMELWKERWKGCDDDEGAKRIEGRGDGYFRPSKARVRLEISLPEDPR
jgi:hypothetical protein